jgi:hypothetical protein
MGWGESLTTLLFIVALSLVVYVVDYRQTVVNMTAQNGNGYGAVAGVLSGDAPLPAQHRVFVPVLCRVFGEPPYFDVYMAVKFVGIFFSLLMAWLCFGSIAGVFALAVFLMFAAMYDYVDGYWEMGFFGACLYLLQFGTVWAGVMLFVLTLVSATNRETTLFFPFLAVAVGQYWLGVVLLCAVLVGMGFPRMEYREAKRYCPFNMLPLNFQRLREVEWNGFKSLMNPTYHFLVVLILLVVAACAFTTLLEWVFVGLFLAMMVPGIWGEVRIFGPCMLVVIPRLVHG